MANDGRFPPQFSSENGGSLSSSYALLTLDDAHVSGSAKPGIRIYAYGLWIPVTSISGATTLTVKVTQDSDGDVVVAGPQTITIETAETSASAGGVATTLNTALITDSTGIYVWAKTDSGTCTAGVTTMTWSF